MEAWTPIPTSKSPAIDTAITAIFGIDRKKSIRDKICPLCNSKIELDSFMDEKSFREFHQSGMCQPCQDKMFA